MNIEDLISQYIDGSLSSEAEAELHHRLAVSPEARSLFRAHIMLKGVARDQRVLHVPTPAMRSSLFERLAREEGMKVPEVVPGTGDDSPAESSVRGDLPVSALPAAETPRSIPSSTVRGNTSRRRRRMLPWLIPIVMAGLMIGVLWNTGEREPRNATTMAGRKVEDVPPAPGAHGGEMVNPSSPQSGYYGDAAPLSDRDERAQSAAGEVHNGATSESAGATGHADHLGEGAPTVEEKHADAPSGTIAQSQSLAMTSEGGNGGTYNRVEMLSTKPTYEQNRSIRSTRSAPNRRSAAADDEVALESEGYGGASPNRQLLPRHRGPEVSMKDGLASTMQNDIAANEEGIGRESLRAKEDMGSDYKMKSPTVQSAPSLAASVPPSVLQSDTAWGAVLSSPEVKTMSQRTVDNERSGRSIRSSNSSSIAFAYGDQNKAADASGNLNSVAQTRGGSAQETSIAADLNEKSEALNPPVLSSNGVDPSSKKGTLTSVPSGAPMTMAPPSAPVEVAPPPMQMESTPSASVESAPPSEPMASVPMIAYDTNSRSEPLRKSTSDDRSVSEGSANMMSSSNAMDAAPSRVHYVAGLNQRSMVDPRTTKMTHQVIVRGGVELGNAHQIYLLVGGSNYSQSGIDLFGGAGYRYMFIVSKGWNVALGGWSGVGARYVRAGAEIPVIYQINRIIRIELIPTVGYARRIDGAGTPDETGTITPGIGFGAGVRF